MKYLNVALYLAGVVTIGVVCNVLASNPLLRWRIDATKTRSYSLSEQTAALLEGLEGDWTIALVLDPARIDEAVRRQVDEVLSRFAASPRISIVRIDPTDPRMLDRYEALLSRLQAIYRDRIDEFEAAIAAGSRAVGELGVFYQQQAGALASLRRELAPGDPAAADIDELLGVAALRLQQITQVESQVADSLAVDESRPLADHETARSVLLAVLSEWAAESHRVERMLAGWRDDESAPTTARTFAAARHDAWGETARALAAAADPLKHLEPLELGRIGRLLETGETAVVIGPGAAAVIPPQQLLPRLNVRERDGQVTFDQRFRGEQAIASAIRSLSSARMPRVILVHAGESLLKPRAQNIDFVGARTVLESSRFDLEEWIVDGSERPASDDRPAVWIVVPPPVAQRRSLAVSDEELALVRAASRLLAEGEAVLLNLCPAAGTRMGRADPWQAVVEPLGLEADTGRVVYEQVLDQQANPVTQRVLTVTAADGSHPIGRAMRGIQSSFDLPIAARPVPAPPAGVVHHVVAALEPSGERWLEQDWMVDPATLDEPQPDERLAEAAPLVVAVERFDPSRPRAQRVVVVGSGGWLLSYLADVVVSMGGERLALVSPGNYELLLASVAWLAGADELIAPSPVSRQVARLDGVTPPVRLRWRWLALAGIPGACMLAGVSVWAVRRRGS